MKFALLSMAAIGVLAGVQAASVDGNNTAVVIRRDNVAAASGHQLLCVPVAPFDITGASTEEAEIPLSDLLPPALYDGCKVTLDSNTSSAKTYEVSNGAWGLVSNQNSSEGAPSVKPGTVLWFYNPKDAVSTGTNTEAVTAATEGDPVIFCGQEKTTNAQPQATAGIASIGNATTAPVTLAALFGQAADVTRNGVTVGQAGDQMYRIEVRGDVNYTYYFHNGHAWYKIAADGQMAKANLADVEIASGEALYYHLGGAQNN